MTLDIAPPAERRRAARVPAPPGQGRRRHRRAVRIASVVVAVTVVLAGAAVVYVRYRIGEIRTVPCHACVAALPGRPFDILLLGADSDLAALGANGTATEAGAASDAIKVLRLDPRARTARLLSIPRDTYVAVPGTSSGTPLRVGAKLGYVYARGPDGVVRAVAAAFGIPVAHFVVFDYSSVVDLVNAVGGISLEFRYPVRDDDGGINHAGLSITTAGCKKLDGAQALAVSRSRYYQYATGPHRWVSDRSGDLGRTERQDAVIEALVARVQATRNPLSVNAFLSSAVHDVTTDRGLTLGAMLGLVRRFEGLGERNLQTLELPTTAQYSPVAGAVQVVQEPDALEAVTQFLGAAPGPVTAPPLAADGLSVQAGDGPGSGSGSGSGSGPGDGDAGVQAQVGTAPYDPVPC